MAGNALVAKKNLESAHVALRKRGRPPGSKSSHTLQVEWARRELIQTYIDNIKPINAALIKKVKSGDVLAIKELHDRVFGKAAQPIVGPGGGPIQMQTIIGMQIKNE